MKETVYDTNDGHKKKEMGSLYSVHDIHVHVMYCYVLKAGILVSKFCIPVIYKHVLHTANTGTQARGSERDVEGIY